MERPESGPERFMGPNKRPKPAKKGQRAGLEAPRRADAEHLPHQETQIQRSGVDQQAFEDIAVPPEVNAPHAACFVEMCKGAFQPAGRKASTRP